MIRILLIMALSLFLTGCGSPLIQMLPGGAGEGINKASITATVSAVRGECTRAPAARRSYRDAVNNELAGMGLAYRVLALDCDGNGQPDF